MIVESMGRDFRREAHDRGITLTKVLLPLRAHHIRAAPHTDHQSTGRIFRCRYYFLFNSSNLIRRFRQK